MRILSQSIRWGCLATLLALSPAAAGQGTGLATGPLRYDGYFGGLRVADVTLTLDGTPQAYDARMEIDAKGIIGFFYTWHGELTASGTLSAATRPRPRSFARSWTDSSDSGETTIAYDPDSGAAQGIEDGTPQEQVPPALRQHVVDPMAVLVALRRLVLRDRRGQVHSPVQVRFPVYDGKRRLDLDATLEPEKTVQIRGRRLTVVPIDADIAPRAGFSDRQREGWRKTSLHILFSSDGRALPVQIQARSPVGTAIMTLACVETCI